jgi:transcription elongation factor SPT5
MEASLDAEKQAEILRHRYAKTRTTRLGGDSAVVPKRLLLPSVDDPSIWAVKCKEGKEREVIFSITKRIEERFGTKDELAITSAFERANANAPIKGYIYVEAQRQAAIEAALDGLMNVYPRTKMLLVEIKEMPDLLRVTKTDPLEPGAYVRLKRPPKYAGDLAQVVDVTENGLEVRVRFVPRLDYGLHEDTNAPGVDAQGKRKRPAAGPRPPPRLFSDVEAKKRHARYLTGNPQTKIWNYMGDEYNNGYCEKDVKIQQIQVKDVNPTLEEVTRFASGAEDGTETLDLNALAASLKASTANASYLPGDIIEVYEGEQKGVFGKAVAVQSDIVTMAITEGQLKGQTIEVPIKGLRKRFRQGDHVKVIGGSRFRDEVGMVVKIVQDRVTLLTDQGNNEITVFSKDLRESSDSGGAGSLGQFELWDLVQLDPATVACIIKVDRESLTVLDQNEQVRTVMPSQIASKLERRKFAVATDRNGSEVRTDDVVKEVGEGGRQGKIMHIHRSFLFLHSAEQAENAGVFVVRTTNVATIAAKGGRIISTAGPDLSSMNPALKLNHGNTNMDMPPPKFVGRDRSIGQTVTIKKGPYKGLLGIVKETTDTTARVELHTKGKTVNVPKDSLAFKNPKTGVTIDPNARPGFRGPNATPRGGFGGRGGYGGATPAASGAWNGGRTPGGQGGPPERTPAWGRGKSSEFSNPIMRTLTFHSAAAGADGGRTPAWKAAADNGGRTPAWQDGSRTSNPYADGSRTAYGAGNRTPAWQASGGKTPAYTGGSDAFAAGSKTPAYGGGDAWGAKTPAYVSTSSNDRDSGAAAGGWGTSFDAPTPGATLTAPTPGGLNAPTPGAYNAPTPGASGVGAPTPAGWGGGGWGGQPDNAPTPGAGLGAPTPGAGPWGAPTPGGWGDAGGEDGPRYTDE